jgi:type I restriction enzyme S subunit
MSEWQTFAVRDVADVFDGPHATPSKTHEGPWYLSISSLSNGRFDFAQSAHLSEADFPRWTKRVAPRPGDTLFSYETRLGEAALWDHDVEAALGRRMGLLRPKPGLVEPRYLTYAYLGPQFQGVIREKTLSGATVDRIPVGDMPSWPLCLPPLDHQRTILEIVGSIDDLIENNRRRVEVLEEMARSIYREWFVKFRYPGHEGVPLVDSALGALPERWSRIGTGELISQQVLEIGDGYRAKNAEMVEGGALPFVRVGNVRDGYLDLANADCLPESYVERLKTKVSRPGDTVLCMKGTVGRMARITSRSRPMAYSPQVSFWRSLDESRLPASYLHDWLRSDDFALQCSAVKGSTDMADYVNLGDQRRMAFLLPATEVASRFAEEVSPLHELSDDLQSQIEAIASLRDLLLPKLVTGQIDVTGLDLDVLVSTCSTPGPAVA